MPVIRHSGTGDGLRELLFVLGILVPPVGCGEELPDVVAIGDRVRIAPIEDVPVCAGSVQTFERYLAEVEERLGIGRSGPITIYWSPTAAEVFCPGGETGWVAACANANERWIASSLLAAPHELAHHVEFAAGGHTIPLLSEGLAVYVEGETVILDERTPLMELVEEDPTETLPAHYAVGGSLIMFIADVWGIEAAIELRRRVTKGAALEAVDTATRASLGVSWVELDAAWRATVPHAASGPRFPRVTTSSEVPPAEAITLDSTLDCDDLSTEGPLDGSLLRGDAFDRGPLEAGMYAHHELVVEIPTEVVLEFVGPAGTRAQLYSRDHWKAVAVEDPGGVVEVVPGEPRSVTLGSGRWQVFLVSEDPREVVNLTLHVRPVPT